MIYRYFTTIFAVCLSIYGECDAGAHKKGEGITIPDVGLRAVIEDSLNKARGEVITAAEMATLTRLEAPNSRVRDLTGIEYATELTVLNLGYVLTNGGRVNSNGISDLSPLSGLTGMKTLHLYTNDVSDLSPLSGMTDLRWLDVSNNLIWDISPLSTLTELRGLALNNNAISDLSPLSGLTNLNRVHSWDCDVSDLSPLLESAGLRGENSLIDFRDNPLSDVSISTHIPVLRERGVRVRLSN